MELKPDKECEKSDDIVFLSEIITNSMYWQVELKDFINETTHILGHYAHPLAHLIEFDSKVVRYMRRQPFYFFLPELFLILANN